MTRRDSTRDRLTITDIAIRERIGYYVARARALKGQYGPVAREGGPAFAVIP
jgi:hypothetical protein